MLRKKLTKGTARATVYTPSDYPRRQYPKLNEDKYVKLLMDWLQELQQKTHPEGGSKSAKNKDLAAFEALQLAGVLVQCVAGWAVDHEAGLALEGLEFVPSVPPEMQNRPEYLAARAAVDDHRHEKNGGDKKGCFKSIVRQKWLINLLRAGHGGFDWELQQELLSTFEALKYNEMGPLIQVTRNNRKVTHQELMLQLEALCFVEYRIGIGGLAKNAVDDVAKMLGQKVSTVRGWKRSLCMELGSVNVSRALFVAKKLGIQNHSRGLDENAQYGDAHLRTLAEQYSTARKFRS